MDKPAIGSTWRARDGRVMQVESCVNSIGSWWVILKVLPPYLPRQRRKTTMNALNFSNGFLTEVKTNG